MQVKPRPLPASSDTSCQLFDLRQGDALTLLRAMPRGSVDAAITSPPYHNNQRDYGQQEGQLALITDLNVYLDQMRAIFEELYRVLRPSGLFWLNTGDARENGFSKAVPARLVLQAMDCGFKLVQDVIWSKNNYPRSASRGPLCQHEYWFLMCRDKGYYYDYEAFKIPRLDRGNGKARVAKEIGRGNQRYTRAPRRFIRDDTSATQNPTSIMKWTSNTDPHKPHQDAFPYGLIEYLVRGSTSSAGVCMGCAKVKLPHNLLHMQHQITSCDCGHLSSVPCTVLDPFAGSGTVPIAAALSGRMGIGLELNESYIRQATAYFQDRAARRDR